MVTLQMVLSKLWNYRQEYMGKNTPRENGTPEDRVDGSHAQRNGGGGEEIYANTAIPNAAW